MTNDRRYYDRYKVTVNANIYGVPDIHELSCVVKDISECGIMFVIPAEYGHMISVGDYISFQLCDSFYIGSCQENYVVSEKAFVRHIEHEPGFMNVGCFVNSEEFRKYIVRKEVSRMISWRQSNQKYYT